MGAKKLRNFLIPIGLWASLLLPLAAEAKGLSCADLFLTVEQRESRSFSFLPKFITERHQRAVVRLAEKDGRLAIQRLSEGSTILNRLDNFSTPALIETVILHRKAPAEFGQHLRAVTEKSDSISTAISANREVPPHIKVLFDLIESRYRTAVEILGTAYTVKTGSRMPVENSDYAYRLIETLRDAIVEIGSSNKYRDYFADFDLRSLDWNGIAVSIEASLAQHPLLAYAGPFDKPIFQADFLAAINTDRSFPQMIGEVSVALEQQLSALPVGISYRVAELTSTVRFGAKQFYGNWFNYTSTDRAAYLRMGRKLGGVMEADLNVSNRKKKMMAILLDRSHQNLDPVFPLENKTGRCFNSCGSFAPILFMRSGVPIISPAYLTPTPTLVSLALQKFLGFGNVEAVRFSQLSPTGAAVDVPVILIHDGGPTNMEIGFYMATLSTIGTVLFSLF